MTHAAAKVAQCGADNHNPNVYKRLKTAAVALCDFENGRSLQKKRVRPERIPPGSLSLVKKRMKTEKQCKECGAPLAGRSDKQFCCDGCRTAYHNRLYRTQRLPEAAVECVLRRNRRLLAEVHSAGRGSVRLSDLSRRGFDSRFFTAMEPCGIFGTAVYHCYDYSFTIRLGRICSIKKMPGKEQIWQI